MTKISPLDAPSLRTPHRRVPSRKQRSEVLKSNVENTSSWRVSRGTFTKIQLYSELFFAESTSQWNVSFRERPQENVLSCTGSQNIRNNEKNENDTASSNWTAAKTIDIPNEAKLIQNKKFEINSALKLSCLTEHDNTKEKSEFQKQGWVYPSLRTLHLKSLARNFDWDSTKLRAVLRWEHFTMKFLVERTTARKRVIVYRFTKHPK